MKTEWTVSIGDFDKDAFLSAVQVHLKNILIKAARAFLLAAIPRIPVRTGFARSAFKNLEDVAGKVSVDAQSGGYRIRGTRGGNSIEKRSTEYYYPPTGGRILKTDQSGRQFATAANDILDIRGASLATGRSAYYFKFHVNITYVDLLDRSIWQAFKTGTEAMAKFINLNLNKGFPQVGTFLARKRT